MLVLVTVVLAGCTPPGLPAPIGGDAASIPASVAPEVPDGTVTIGIDGASAVGFNPHSIIDYSPVEQAVASMVLPSVSRPGTDGTPHPDPDLVSSASVTSTDPFTVTYQLQRSAAWSDGTPITADDFSYLWLQMVTQPATVDPAGYRLISQIRAADGGKTVTVEFSRPVADWLTLFSPLLPAHLLKDAPGGWEGALAGGIPVSGNAYKMQDNDATTGQITLVRNDKFWGRQPGPQTVVLRLGESADLAQALARGDLQAALLVPDDSTRQVLDAGTAVPASDQALIPVPATVQIMFATAGATAGKSQPVGDDSDGGAATPTTTANTPPAPEPVTASATVRRALATALSPTGLSRQLVGGSPAALVPGSQVHLPETSGGASPVAVGDREAAGRLLDQAGWVQGAGIYRVKQGRVLSVVLGYPSSDAALRRVALAIQSDLAQVGVQVTIRQDDPTVLLAGDLSGGVVQAALVTRPRGPSDVLAAASAFGCAPAQVPADLPSTGSAAGSPTGFCDGQVESDLSAAIGSNPQSAAPEVGRADARLWTELPVLPLLRPQLIFAVGPTLRSVLTDRDGWAWDGPLADVASWPTK